MKSRLKPNLLHAPLSTPGIVEQLSCINQTKSMTWNDCVVNFLKYMENGFTTLVHFIRELMPKVFNFGVTYSVAGSLKL